MPCNNNLWNSKAEKEKFPEQTTTDLGILSESTIQISFIREIDILKSIVVTTNSLTGELL